MNIISLSMIANIFNVALKLVLFIACIKFIFTKIEK